ncbi:pyridoxamine 5'-phosphate oxidase family protein [Streptomyces zagrosensis]|uniref:PPOX class probable F420-dependent enzyme n=1 Tax=Streptomyces zagrosensis TaxID=1042984 RepID=A0A7W9Q7A4_9ACTN|nr:pyridoxamine 5'-phosphate oxidase family protein [Streptomyces zagrosensis]MBB5933847.1 PPOX class probable F420-dependent enzyme [Streptomyces zagrosensis]
MAIDLDHPAPDYVTFWRERHLCTFTTPRPNGTPHVAPVGVTYDPEARTAWIICRKTSTKVANVIAAGPAGAPVAVCQLEGRRWATLEGRATVRTDAESIAEAVRRYAERYGRMPRPNPERVAIKISLTRGMGNV